MTTFYAIPLEDYTPGARHPVNGVQALPWTQVEISQADPRHRGGPYTVIDVQGLTPVDTDPEHPQSRKISTNQATIPVGWFKVAFLDANDVRDEADPVYFPGGLRPSVDEVAARIPTRTKAVGGTSELGTFADPDPNDPSVPYTRPSATEVETLIDQAVTDLLGSTGTISEDQEPQFRSVASLYTAMLVELTRFPEQIRAGTSPYPQLKDLYDAALKALLKAIEEVGVGGQVGPGDDEPLPLHSFATTPLVGPGTVY